MTIGYTQSFAENDALSPQEQQRLGQYKAQLSALAQQAGQQPEAAAKPLLALPYDVASIAEIKALAKTIRASAKGLIVIGTGGSSLGAKTLCALSGDAFKMHFLENLDPHSMQCLLDDPQLGEYHLLMVSKSGGTMETICQSLIVLEAMKARIGAEALSKQAHAITMPGKRALRDLAQQYGIEVLDHHPEVGGRFSVLSNVGLLPAACAGVDIAEVCEGARSFYDALDEQGADCPALVGAAWQAALMPSRPVSVLMPYCDRLSLFGDWYRQLWAESLGKNGLGSTPVPALGAVDQHSQLQLYLGGPKDKSFTLLALNNAGKGAAIPPSPMGGFDYLKGKHIGDAMRALQEGTSQTIERRGLPLRRLAIEDLDAKTLGALLMHFILETMICAQLIGVNAYDQPEVEESKDLARAALSGGRSTEAA